MVKRNKVWFSGLRLTNITQLSLVFLASYWNFLDSTLKYFKALPQSVPSHSSIAHSLSCKPCRSTRVVKYGTKSPFPKLVSCQMLEKLSDFSKRKSSFLCLLGPSKLILTKMDAAHTMAFSFFNAWFNTLLVLIYFHTCHVLYSLKVVPTPHLSRVLHAQSITHWFYRPHISWGQNYHAN
jgi:hypothetical protein